jgi:hypothetical protein
VLSGGGRYLLEDVWCRSRIDAQSVRLSADLTVPPLDAGRPQGALGRGAVMPRLHFFLLTTFPMGVVYQWDNGRCFFESTGASAMVGEDASEGCNWTDLLGLDASALLGNRSISTCNASLGPHDRWMLNKSDAPANTAPIIDTRLANLLRSIASSMSRYCFTLVLAAKSMSHSLTPLEDAMKKNGSSLLSVACLNFSASCWNMSSGMRYTCPLDARTPAALIIADPVRPVPLTSSDSLMLDPVGVCAFSMRYPSTLCALT